jgi:hypothetical protein
MSVLPSQIEDLPAIDKSERAFYNNKGQEFQEAAIDSLLKSPIGDDL